MPTIAEDFQPFAERMQQAGRHELEIRTFEAYYQQLREGQTGFISEAEIEPVSDLPDAERVPPELAEQGRAALAKTILLKLNGGLGTSMGLERAKSLLKVKDDLAFLDVIARHALHSGVPLLLMNSENTEADSLEVLAAYSDLKKGELPLSFQQSIFPKIKRDDFSPVSWSDDPRLEWYPPGHGNLYLSLVISGMLDQLLAAGYEYAFVSNADNLGASIDPLILGYFAANSFPFLMEVADRTEADKKGGHLARRPDGQLLLRESAQCPPEEQDAFQDVSRYRYFNTNNIWLNLTSLKQMVDTSIEQVTVLPLIHNPKTVDPRDSKSTPVFQLETAMGSAIMVFAGAQAIRVPRTRFAPVKTTGDLLAVRSDAFRLTEDYRIIPDPGHVVVSLDSQFYKLIDGLEARIPQGPPSLRECSSLTVQGDVSFGADVTCRGNVSLQNQSSSQVRVADGSVLEGETRWH
jgi:UTP--glucose-1-phosphate uridylyltransferase